MATIYWYQGDSTAEQVLQVRLGEVSGLPTDARLGQSATGSLIVDDPDGTLEFKTWRRFWVEDDEAPAGNQRVWTGYITHISVNHGPNRSAAGRVWNLTLCDINNILHHRKVRPTDTGHDRPAETDIERLTWWLATDWADGVIYTDLSLVDTTGPVDLDAEDLVGKYFGDILADLSNASGKNHLLVYHEAEDHRDLVYAFNDSDLWQSTAAISNVLTDVDWDTVFPPETPGAEFPDATLEIDGEKNYDGAYVTYTGGAFYRVSGADPGEVFRDTDIDIPEASSLTTAEATADRELADLDAPNEEVSLSLFLPRTHVTLVKPWHRLPVRLTHLPGYEAARDARIVSHTIRQDSPGATDDWYRVDLTLSPLAAAMPHFLLAFVSTNGTSNNGEVTTTWGPAWTLLDASGNYGYPVQTRACGAGLPDGAPLAVYWREIGAGESTHVWDFVGDGASYAARVYEIAGVDPSGIDIVTDMFCIDDDADASITTTVAEHSVLIGRIAFAKVGYDGGWCIGGMNGPVQTVNGVAGTELVNLGGNLVCDGTPPWLWIAAVEGTGTLTITCHANSYGAGYGAYACGYMCYSQGVVLPSTHYAIIQYGDAGGGLGSTAQVFLPSPPTP